MSKVPGLEPRRLQRSFVGPKIVCSLLLLVFLTCGPATPAGDTDIRFIAPPDWKQVTDQQGQYSVMTPPDVTSESTGDGLVVSHAASSITPGTDHPSLRFQVDLNPANLSMQDYYDGEPGVDLMGQSGGEFSIISVAGRPAFQFDPFISLSGGLVTVIPTNGAFLRVFDDGGTFDASGTLDTIIQSLTF